MKIGNLEIDLKELTNFVVEAKRNRYSGGGETRMERDGSRTFLFHKGSFFYTDNYAGSYKVHGNEFVRWQKEDGRRIWHMFRSGGIVPEFLGNERVREHTFAFLREASKMVSFSHPFRGPPKHENEDLEYTMEVCGNITEFFGTEDINNKILRGNVLFQDFMGGVVC